MSSKPGWRRFGSKCSESTPSAFLINSSIWEDTPCWRSAWFLKSKRLSAGSLFDFKNQADRQQGVSSQIEEFIRNADGVDSEHLLPNLRQPGFELIRRC